MGPYQSVLAQIVADRGLPPEPIATTAFVHLLRRSGTAAAALARLAAEICPALPDVPLWWSGQVVAEADSGLPDLVGSDDSGARVVLEAKFDAELTSAQRGQTYLERLKPNGTGLLLYVAPADRLPALWPQLLKGPGGQAAPPPPNLAHADAIWLAEAAPGGRYLAVVPWQVLLDRLRDALEGGADKAAFGDFEQLDDLVRARIGHQWVPVMPGDLPERVGRQLSGIRKSVIKAAGSLGLRMSNGTSDHASGRWLTLSNDIVLWAGLWPGMWGRNGVSPTWLTIHARGDFTPATVFEALAPLRANGGPGVFPHDGAWAVPLVVGLGIEKGKVTQELREQIERVVILLDPSYPALHPSGYAGSGSQEVDGPGPLLSSNATTDEPVEKANNLSDIGE